MQQLYFSLDKTNQLGKFKRVQTCNSYVSHCAFRLDFQCGNAKGNDQKKAAAEALLGRRGTESLFSHSNVEDSDH